jgi:hypothetical protein
MKLINKILSVLIVRLLAPVVVLAGCADSSNDNSTNLRFLNAVVGLDSVDMLVDNDTYLEGIAYLESTAYLEFDTDPHFFQITPSNSLSPIDTERVSLQDDVDYTYIACGNSSDAEAILLKDDNEPAGDKNFKVRIVNLFKGSRGFDVYITSTPDQIDQLQPTAKQIGFKVASRYGAARSGVYDIVVKSTATGKVATILANQEFKPQDVYSVFLVPEAARPEQVRVLVLTDHDGED